MLAQLDTPLLIFNRQENSVTDRQTEIAYLQQGGLSGVESGVTLHLRTQSILSWKHTNTSDFPSQTSERNPAEISNLELGNTNFQVQMERGITP